MSTKLPLLYSMFGLAGTGGEGDSLCPVSPMASRLTHPPITAPHPFPGEMSLPVGIFWNIAFFFIIVTSLLGNIAVIWIVARE